MGKPRDLLKEQEISFDNHQSVKEAEWNDDLHFHKKMTVSDQKGKATEVSGVFHVNRNRGIDVTYDRGKEHPKIKNKKEREYFSNKIKKEISGVLEKSNDEAHSFLKRVMEKIDSISSGQSQKEKARRKNQAFDSIMDSLGITPQRKVVLRNKNNDILSLYVENNGDGEGIEALLFLIRWYNRYYLYRKLEDINVYYITFQQGKLTMGELTPYSFLKYKRQGFGLTISGVLESLNHDLLDDIPDSVE